MRRPIVCANWKLHKTVGESLAFAEAFLPAAKELREVELALAPPFTALVRLGEALSGSAVALAAQDVSRHAKGAFTGEVAASMLADAGCRYGIVGHSERRALHGENDALVAAKAEALLEAGIAPIVCVGERLEEREAGRTLEVIGGQLAGSLAGIGAARIAEVVVAYEPVWAIGTGKTATPEIAQEAHAALRGRLREFFGEACAEAVRIQYGGSVKPDNAAALMAQPDIDGALVGGASLEPESFAAIARAANAGGKS